MWCSFYVPTCYVGYFTGDCLFHVFSWMFNGLSMVFLCDLIKKCLAERGERLGRARTSVQAINTRRVLASHEENILLSCLFFYLSLAFSLSLALWRCISKSKGWRHRGKIGQNNEKYWTGPFEKVHKFGPGSSRHFQNATAKSIPRWINLQINFATSTCELRIQYRLLFVSKSEHIAHPVTPDCCQKYTKLPR